MHVYEVRPRKDKLGVDLISDALQLPPARFAGSRENANCLPDDRAVGGMLAMNLGAFMT
jgi:hypothetical protein